jgi:hypothetical protein
MGRGRAAFGRTATVVAVFAVFAVGASAASAATVATDCTNFGPTLSAAAGTNGETIVLTGLCTGANAHFALPSTATNLTIEGASSGVNGFDGTGVTNSALSGLNMDGLTLRNLTFENYSLTTNGAVNLLLSGSGALPTIDSDRFINNSLTTTFFSLQAAGLQILVFGSACPLTPGSLTITNSTFSGNMTTTSDTLASDPTFGGGAGVQFVCTPPNTANLVVTGNTFSGNSIHTAGSAAFGAGLYAGNGSNQQLTAQQSGNVFQGNSIVSTAVTPTSYNGAGEWVGTINLTSTGDEFIGNALPGPSGASASSEGAGFGVVRGSCGGTPAADSTATATNLVAVDNTIGAPSSGGSVEGAGVYAGVVACGPTQGTGGFHLTLINSTVSGNSGPGGAAGIDGESTDVLTLQNSIVNGDTGAGSSEIGGFGGGITATHSDLCNGSSPLAGTGNICADPKLAGVASGDVHETSASPTIDAGSNALVPSGVTTDFYGQNRIVGTTQAGAIVDIGAAEDQTAFVPPPSGPGKVGISGETTIPGGFKVNITCTGAATQSCNGNAIATTTETLQGSKVIAIAASVKRHKRVVTVARATYKLTGGQRITLKVKLNRKGKRLLKRFGKLPVIVKITQLNTAGQQATISHKKLTIKPRHKKHR